MNQPPQSVEQMSNQLQVLQMQLAELEQIVAEREQTIQVLHFNGDRAQLILESSPDPIVLYDTSGRVEYINPAFTRTFGWTLDELRGQRLDFVPEKNQPETQNAIKQIYSGVQAVRFETQRYTKDGQIIDVMPSASLLYDRQGERAGLIVFLQDISERKQSERERAVLVAQVEAAEEHARRLNTPLIPVADGLVVLPLVGSIDQKRAQQALETILTGIGEHHAAIVIVDITGVPVVNLEVAATLLQAAQAARLLGARMLLTGIRPEVAQTLIGLGVDLGTIMTRSTLQSGIALALNEFNKPSGRFTAH